MNRAMVRQLAPATAGTLTAMLPMETTPFLISGSIRIGHLSVEAAGWIGTASLAAVAAGSMLLSPLLGRIPLRRAAMAFSLMTMASYLLMAVAKSFLAFMILAIAAGGACGCLLACMAMVVAATPDPDRSYGIIYASTGIFFAALLFLLPTVGELVSPAMMFVLIAAVALLAFPILSRVRVGGDVGDAGSGIEPASINWAWVGLLIFVMSIAFPVYGGTYGFAERKAVEVGLTSVQAGMVISMATLLSIVGTVCVATVGTRFGRLAPTLTVMIVATVAYGLTLRSTDPTGFIIGFLIFGLMQLALNAYFFGLASALDREGRVAALLQGYSLIPYALGPGIFGSLTEGGALTSLAAPAVVINLVATGLLLPMLIALDRRAGFGGRAWERSPASCQDAASVPATSAVRGSSRGR